MKFRIQFWLRVKQLLCRHPSGLRWVSFSQGLNRLEGYWNGNYACDGCGYHENRWVKETEKEVIEAFGGEEHVPLRRSAASYQPVEEQEKAKAVYPVQFPECPYCRTEVREEEGVENGEGVITCRMCYRKFLSRVVYSLKGFKNYGLCQVCEDPACPDGRCKSTD